MKFLICLLLLTSISLELTHHSCSYRTGKYPNLIKKPLKKIPINDLPSDFFWGNVSGTNYLTLVRN